MDLDPLLTPRRSEPRWVMFFLSIRYQLSKQQFSVHSESLRYPLEPTFNHHWIHCGVCVCPGNSWILLHKHQIWRCGWTLLGRQPEWLHCLHCLLHHFLHHLLCHRLLWIGSTQVPRKHDRYGHLHPFFVCVGVKYCHLSWCVLGFHGYRNHRCTLFGIDSLFIPNQDRLYWLGNLLICRILDPLPFWNFGHRFLC